MTSRSQRMLNQLLIAPRVPEIDERKRRFNDINAYVSERGGWVTSVPGAHEMTFDALPGSPLPELLTALGYLVTLIGTSERVLPHAVSQKFQVAPDGTLLPPTEGSTKPVTVTVTNAGITAVEQFDLRVS